MAKDNIKNGQSLQDLERELWTSFRHISKKMILYSDDDDKYVKLATIQQKLAASILNCFQAERGFGIASEDEDDEFAKLVAKLEEEKKITQGEKKALMIFR
ncbi:MAG: hypothetical protein ACYC9R_12185 [Nitrosotalea sp.]